MPTDPRQPAGRRISSGTLIVVAILLLAVLIAVGRAWLKRTGDQFTPPSAVDSGGQP